MAIKIYTTENLPKPNMAEIERIKNMSDNEIDTTEIPELTPAQLKEAAAIARKKRRFSFAEKAAVSL